MDNILYIDEYFTGQPSVLVKENFEKRIAEDPAFAAEVAFYLSSKDIIKQELILKNKERFKSLYDDYKQTNNTGARPVIFRKLLRYAAVAAILTAIIIGWFLYSNSDSSQELADKFINQNFKVLSVTMGSKEDGLQTGIRLFNEGKLSEALNQFESIAVTDSSNHEIKKYLGIVSLRMQQYDKAITYFSQLADNTNLYANPGKLYQAITLLKRDNPDDKSYAKDLLQQVLQNDLDGKETAKLLLDKW